MPLAENGMENDACNLGLCTSKRGYVRKLTPEAHCDGLRVIFYNLLLLAAGAELFC